MGILDPIVDLIYAYFREQNEETLRRKGLKTEGMDRNETDEAADQWEEAVEGAFGAPFDIAEDEVLEEFRETGEITPENVERVITQAEGNALELGVASLAGTLGIEALGLTQMESHQFQVSQIMSFLALEDVLGRRVATAYSEGIDPALQAEIGKRARSKFVDFPDAVEYALREKETDEGWLHASGAGGDADQVVGSNEPVNPENMLEEWGIRDDQLPLLERVALEAVEPEELLEEPIQFGIVPDREVVEEVLDLSGLPEDAKGLFLEVVDAAPKSADIWEQRTATDELVTSLDTLVEDQTLTPEQATDYVMQFVSEPDSRQAFINRWEALEGLPGDSPTGGEVDRWHRQGVLSDSEYQTLLERLELDPAWIDRKTEDNTIRQGADGIVDAWVFDRISRAGALTRLERIGLTRDEASRVLDGEELSVIRKERLGTSQTEEGEPQGPASRPVTDVPGIGTSRGTVLQAGGIDTVGALASATVPQVTALSGASDEQARQWITIARQLTPAEEGPVEIPSQEEQPAQQTEQTEQTGEEELALQDITGVGPTFAADLRELGLETVQAVAGADPEVIQEIDGIGPESAEEIIQSARELTGAGS